MNADLFQAPSPVSTSLPARTAARVATRWLIVSALLSFVVVLISLLTVAGPEPRSAEGVECRKCNEIGHFSKDCPKAGPRGCRNCGQEGHMAKECTEPRNMANVQCRNCDEMGHDAKSCPKPRDSKSYRLELLTCDMC